MTSLDILKDLKEHYHFEIDGELKLFVIATELRALEILKNKPFIDFHLIKTYDTVTDANAYIQYMYGYKSTSVLTPEEFNLLKSVLWNKILYFSAYLS